MQVVMGGGRERVELAVHVGFGLTVAGVTWLLARVALPSGSQAGALGPTGWWQPGWRWPTLWPACCTSSDTPRWRSPTAVACTASPYGFAAAARRSAGRGAHEQLLTALSGPLSHLLLAALFWTIWRVASADNVPRRVAFPAATNLLVGVLNLRPLRPLDGRRVLRAASRVLARQWVKPARKLRIVDTRKPTGVWRVAGQPDRSRRQRAA